MSSAFSRTWIPNQHGAWAMLIAPVVVGALAAGPNPWHLLMLVTWLAAFCLNFYLQLAIKSRKPAKYQRQLAVYGGVTAVLGIGLVAHDPDVLRMLLFAVPAFAVNVAFVLQRNERAWVNDVVGIALAGVVGYGAFLLGAGSPSDAGARHAFLAVLATCLYFVGTVIYVKTLIRERGNRVWLYLSYGFHTALLLLCLGTSSWALAVVATALLTRAVYVPTQRWTPKRVGLLEIPSTVAVSLLALITLP